MPEEVDYMEDQELIRVRAFGKVTVEDWRESLKQVSAMVEARNVNRLLVDAIEQTNTPDMLSTLEFAEELPVTLKIAIVHVEEAQFRQRFIETASRSRGKQVRIFTQYDEAIDWLESETSH